MNFENLHNIIDCYEENYNFFNEEHDEIFKWRAARCFKDIWFSDEAEKLPFSRLFSKATKECSVLVDNSRTSPMNGVVKVAERYSAEVKHLFKDVLFSETDNIDEIQKNMDLFVDEFNKLCLKAYPNSYKFKQDRHAASCYLALYKPEKYFIYRYNCAENFANKIEFGIDIGSGGSFKLSAYHKLCNVIIDALTEDRHKSLLDKYYKRISDEKEFYKDESLHLLVFDIIYCYRTYEEKFPELQYVSKKESIKAYKLEQLKQGEIRMKNEMISSLRNEIRATELKLDEFNDISLIGIEVNQIKNGKGVIIDQNKNTVHIQFESDIKKFMLGNQYSSGVHFDNDEEILKTFTEYADLLKKLDSQKNELERLLRK